MLRLLGSACVVSLPLRGGHEPVLDIDCILPGISYTSIVSDQLKSALRSVIEGTSTSMFSDGTDAQACDIFYRIRRNYDQSQGRYLSPWRRKTVRLRPFRPSSTSGSTDSDCSIGVDGDNTFSVQWTQLTPLSAAAWTSDARYFGEHVLGELSIFFPSITFFGHSTILEIEELLIGGFGQN